MPLSTPKQKPTAGRRPTRFGRFAADRRGVSAVEFALLLPLLITLFFGGHEVSQAITIYRKVSHMASTLGDLVAQVSSLNAADMSNVFDASTAIMSPYPSANAKMVVSAVSWNSSTSVWKVEWSKTRNGTAWTVGVAPPTAPPDSLKSSTQWVIVATVDYTYVSGFSAIMQDIWGSNSITLSDVATLRPRLSDKVLFN